MKGLPKAQRHVITRSRETAHKLCIETGWYGNASNGTKREREKKKRLRQVCLDGQSERQISFYICILTCDRYTFVSKRYLNNNFISRPSMY